MLHATMLIFADAYILSLAGLPVMSLVKIHPQRTWCNNIPQIKLKWPPHYYHPKSFKKLVLLNLDGCQYDAVTSWYCTVDTKFFTYIIILCILSVLA